jgi:glycosyltransferase involved in cell wall biosynthesis
MRKYVIISRLESFDFPLYEATRKQVWWNAKKRQAEGYSVSVVLLSNFNKKFVNEDIDIMFVNRWLFDPFIVADKIQFITGSVSVWLLLGVFFRGKKTVTLTDGNMLGEKHVKFRKIIVKCLPLVYKQIIVYSNYQLNRLNINKAIIKAPLLPIIYVDSNIKRASVPTLLYMGHLSYFKGVDTIINSFKEIINEFPNLILIIANNSVRGDKDLINEITKLKQTYPINVVIKGVVDPIKELSEAWVYLYPFKEAIGTMAFALSLYEAESCNTPYIACDIGANKEFFNSEYLIDVNDSCAMTKKIKQFIDDRKNQENIQK